MDRRQRPGRAGFTLVEVLVAILIIATLIAILLPAVFGAMRKAREAQVSAEITNLANALASFNNQFGAYPPSRVILCEAGYATYLANLTDGPAGPLSPSGNDTDLNISQLVQRSRLYMRRFWPRVDFDNGTIPFDFNNNGSTSDVIFLTGSECLVFFLGGIPINDGNNTYTMSGFSKSPVNPFNATATNRTVPSYEFVSGRLIDQDVDHMPSYVDPLDLSIHRSYVYFSAYGTNAYDPNDDNGYGRNPGLDLNWEFEDDGSTYVERPFTVSFPPGSVISPSPNPYTSGDPTVSNVGWVNPNSFQLFSAGQDRYFGLGGTYNQNATGDTGRLPVVGTLTNSIDAGNGIRNRENDNLTNFSGGRLN
jgi:general secretion pathway protein G